MDIVEFVEKISGLKLLDFQKLYLNRIYDIYEKDPDSFNKFTYPCVRGYARFNQIPLLATIFSLFNKFNKEVEDESRSGSENKNT